MKLENIIIKKPINRENIYISDITYDDKDLIIDINNCSIHSTYIYIDELKEINKLTEIFERIVNIMFQSQEQWFGKHKFNFDECFDLLDMFSEKSTEDILILDILKDNKILYNSKVNISIKINNISFYKSKGIVNIDIHSIKPILTQCKIDSIDNSEIEENVDLKKVEPHINVKEELNLDINRIEMSIKNIKKKSDEYLQKYLQEKLKEESAQIKLNSLTQQKL